MGKNRRRIYALVGAAAVAGALLAVAPALGDHQGGSVTQVEFRAFGDGGPRIVAAGHPDQLLLTKNNACDLADNGSLLKIEGDNRGPGIANAGIGVKSSGSNSNGTPCSQVDSKEKLSIRPGSSVSGRAFSGVELDLEMAGNAIVKMTFSPASGSPVTYELHTGTSFTALCATTQDGGAPWPGCDGTAGNPTVVTSVSGVLKAGCNAPQNSGPNSGASDNCIWIVAPGFDATLIELTTSVGTVSLEGGSDTNRPSIFYLADNTPDALDDTDFIGQDDTSITIDVLANDTPQTPSPRIEAVTEPSSGVATILVDGVDGHTGRDKIRYTPTAEFDGYDTFQYTLNGGSTADVFVYELFGCDDQLGVGPNVDGVEANYERLPSVDCPDKSYVLDITTTGNLSTILFQPRTPGPHADCSLAPDDCVEEFKGTITFEARNAANPFAIGTLEYDPAFVADLADADFRPMSWCLFDPFDPPAPVGDEEALTRRDALPSAESWCIVSATNSVQDDGKVKTTWVVYGIGDPLKRVS